VELIKKRRVLARVGGSGAAAAVMVGGGWLLTAAPATAAPQTQQFDFTGAAQEFVVPANVCQVTIDAFGAEGGDGESNDPGGFGGLGGRATATLTVTPGETLQVNVGGAGGDGTGGSTAAAGAEGPGRSVHAGVMGGTPGAGGFNGGAEGVAPAVTIPAAAAEECPTCAKAAPRS